MIHVKKLMKKKPAKGSRYRGRLGYAHRAVRIEKREPQQRRDYRISISVSDDFIFSILLSIKEEKERYDDN